MRRNKSSKKRVRNILIALIILGISVIIFMFCFYKYNLTSVSNDNTAKNVEITGTATQIGNKYIARYLDTSDGAIVNIKLEPQTALLISKEIYETAKEIYNIVCKL